jgi:hypothetical protein
MSSRPDAELAPGALVAFKPGSPPRARGFRRAVVIEVDVPAMDALYRTAGRLLELGQAAEALLAVLWAAECELRDVETRGVLVRCEAAAVAGLDFFIPAGVVDAWLDVAGTAAGIEAN